MPADDAPRVLRRDEAAHPAWFVDPHAPESERPTVPWVGRPVARRPMSGLRLTAVLAIAGFLVVQVAGSVVAYVNADAAELPVLLAGSVFTLIVEAAGWWVVYRLITRR